MVRNCITRHTNTYFVRMIYEFVPCTNTKFGKLLITKKLVFPIWLSPKRLIFKATKSSLDSGFWRRLVLLFWWWGRQRISLDFGDDDDDGAKVEEGVWFGDITAETGNTRYRTGFPRQDMSSRSMTRLMQRRSNVTRRLTLRLRVKWWCTIFLISRL